MSEEYAATLEYAKGGRIGVLALFDKRGEWSGASRIEGRNRGEIYELAYDRADASAVMKGGRLGRLSVIDAPREFKSDACAHAIEMEMERRPANALNLEIGQPLTRCRLKTPDHWGGADPKAARWLLSGGSPLVLGYCACSACPKRTLLAQPHDKAVQS